MADDLTLDGSSGNPKNPRPPGARPRAVLRSPDAETRHETFEASDGTRLYYSVEGSGQPLIFCYGLVCSSLHWTYQIDHFRRSHQAIWMDYRGHQNSELPQDLSTLTIETLASDLDRLCETLGIGPAVLLGHSMGVNVVLEFQRRFPNRVKAMVLANGTPRSPLETMFSTNAFQKIFEGLRLLQRLAPGTYRKLWRLQKGNQLIRSLMLLGGFNPHLTPIEDVGLYVDQVADLDPEVLLRLMASYENWDATSWLHTLRIPTLIISGREDRVIPLAQQELMHQLIPGSEFFPVAHGSHCPQMDLPGLVNARIIEFLKKIP